MRFLLIAATGILCAILAGTLAGLIGDLYTRWFHVSQREGGAGYLVAFLILAGGIAGLITGIAAGAANDAFLPGLGWGAGIVVSVASVIFAFCYLLGDIPPTSGFEGLDLVTEIRTPEGAPITNRMKANGAATRLIRVLPDGSNGYSSSDHGKWTKEGLVTTRMRIFASKGGWKIEVYVKDGLVAEFPALELGPMRPGKEWSTWRESSTGYRLRHRIARRSEEQEKPQAAAAAGLKQLPVLDDKAPLEKWLRFLDAYYNRRNDQYADENAAEQMRMRAVQVITSRPDDVIILIKAAGPGNMRLAELAVNSVVVPESFGAPLRGMLPRFEEAVRVYRKESPAGDPDILRAGKLKDDFQVWCNLWERFQGFHPDAERPSLDSLEKAAREAPEDDPIHEFVGHIEGFREFTLNRKP